MILKKVTFLDMRNVGRAWEKWMPQVVVCLRELNGIVGDLIHYINYSFFDVDVLLN